MHSIKPVFLLFLMLSVQFQLQAQNKQVTVITFKLDNGQPAAKATVLFGRTTNPKNRTAKFTDSLGIIHLPYDSGRYSVYATYTGMEPIIDTLSGNNRSDTVHYQFRPKIKELSAVTVVARKKILEVKEDRFIYNVSADSSARLKSISQVLGNLPFVTVDGTGEVRVAGQTNYKVLLNGKETALFVSSIAQALRSFPAEIVARIELITAPAARYDAEGITAVINIITKKFAGYKGFQTIYASNLSHYSAGLTLTGRAGKLGITLNTTTDGTWNYLTEYRKTVTTPFSISAYNDRIADATEAVKRMTSGATIELNFEMDSVHSVIGYFTADRSVLNNNQQQEIQTRLLNGNQSQGFISTENSDHSPGLTAGVDFTKKSRKNTRKELSFRFNWKGNDNRINTYTEQKYPSVSKWMINHSAAKNDEYTFQLDAVPLALKKFSLEAGLKTILRRASSDYTSLFTFNRNSIYLKDADNSNSFNYSQQVYAVYSTVSANVKKSTIHAGLRLEQTMIKGMFNNLANPVNDDYLSVIPNFYWSTKTGKSTSISLAYNLNLLRPYITSLNPFKNNIDSFNISYGNPELGPQLIHKLVAQFRYAKEKLFITGTLTGSFSNNEILSYRLFDSPTGITSITFGNVGNEQLISIGGSINYQFSKKLKAGLWGDIRYVDIQNRIQKQQHNYGYSGIVGSFFSCDVGSRLNLSGSGGYDVRNVTLLGRRSPYIFYQVNTGFHIIRNKLYATINWNNIHRDYFTIRTNFQDDAVRSETSSKRLYRVIYLGFQFTFGKLKEEVERKKGVINNDIL